MNLSEHQIEEIIYQSPWLLDENYIIPAIKGSRGENGRQVNPVKGVNKFIDLLFKDARDNRPVLIELKKGQLTRESLGQILEYKGLLLSLDDTEKELWTSEFCKNYYCPKLILIGSEVEENIRIAANLAGVEVKTFNADFSEIGLTTFESIVQSQKEWNRFRNSGKRALHEREEWINDLLERINEFLQDFPAEVYTIKKVPLPTQSKLYTPQGNPFINIPFYYGDDNCISGIYEFYDESIPFDDEYIYFEFIFVNETFEKILLDDLKQQAIDFCILNNIEYAAIGPNLMPIIKIKREVLENTKEFNHLLGKFLTKSLEIYHLQIMQYNPVH